MRVRSWLPAILALTLLAGSGCGKKKESRPESELLRAAAEGDTQKVQSLAASGVSMDATDSRGRTPLHNAAERGHLEVVRLLIRCGASVDVRDGDGRTPVMLALAGDHRSVVELLIDAGAKAGDANQDLDALLLRATWEGKAEMVKFLIAKGADPNKHGEPNHFLDDTPLAIAVCAGRIDIVELLIDGGADVKVKDESGWSLLHVAATQYDEPGQSRTPAVEMMKLLVAHGASVKARDEEELTPLHCAAYKGHEDVVAFLLARGADVNARTVPDPRPDQGSWERDLGFRLGPGVTPLHEAVAAWYPVVGGNPNVVGLLLAHGAEVDASDESGSTPLHYAAAQAGRKVAEVLIAAGADVNARNKDGTTPLAIALRRGNVETARALIAAGAQKVVMKNHSPRIRIEYESKHEPVLHLAIVGRSEMPWQHDPSDAEPNLAEFRREWMELLLANGADPEERDEKGNTALLAALLVGDEIAARRLVDHGCDLNARNQAGTTALHLAAIDNREVFASLLLAKGANVNAQDADGDTPLHSASLRGHKKMVESFLAHKADPNLRNSRGRTPADEALRRGHEEIVLLLGAKGR